MIHVALWVAAALFLGYVGLQACRYAARGVDEVVGELAGTRVDPVAIRFVLWVLVFAGGCGLLTLLGHGR